MMTDQLEFETELLRLPAERLHALNQCETAEFHVIDGAPTPSFNESLRWRISEEGGHIEMSVTDITGHDLSIVMELSEFWELVLSFVGTTAAALERHPVKRKSPRSMLPTALKLMAEKVVSTVFARPPSPRARETERYV